MAEIENSIREAVGEFESKLREGVLPPDPARIVKEILAVSYTHLTLPTICSV